MSREDLDIKLLEDFRDKFLYFSEGLRYFFERYEFSFQDLNLPSNAQQFNFYGRGIIESSDNIYQDLRKYANKELSCFIVPTETIDPPRSQHLDYLLQLRKNNKRSHYIPIYQGLSTLQENGFLPIIFSRDLRDYPQRSPSLPIGLLECSKMNIGESTIDDFRKKSKSKIELIKKMEKEKQISHM